jgi:DNA-binding beta-propeller fold protein YncE
MPDLDMVYGMDAFRIGVQAYYRAAYNEAILSFDQARSYKPEEPLFLEWLGKANYRAGYEDTAINLWREAARAYGYSSGASLLLGSSIETVQTRRALELAPLGGADPAGDDRFVESGRYPGLNGDVRLYRQPVNLLPEEDGSVWTVAYGSNEIVRIDVNGIIRERLRGPLNGFDRPYGIARGPEGNFYVSETRGCRVSVLDGKGQWQYYIGDKGLGPGQFIGPQGIAVDPAGYLYVVDYGNARVSKFDPSGAFLLSFGQKSPFYEGLVSPTGIAAAGGRVFIADNVRKEIVMFDGSGGFLGVLTDEGLAAPESLRFLDNGLLLASDLNRVLVIDPETAIVRELGVLGSAERVRLTDAALDRNGNVLAADFKTGEVTIMTRMADMASGLFVQIERVVSDAFPLVTVEVQVQDRRRRPIVGLDANNFLITEGGRPVAAQSFEGAAWRNTDSSLAVLIERSPEAKAHTDELAAALRDISAAGSRIVAVVSAGQKPLLEAFDQASPRSLAAAARGSAASYSPRWTFGQGLRLAASTLFGGAKKRAVVFVTSGGIGELAFEQYNLSELAAYLANNDTVFYAVLVGGGTLDESLRFICEQTGGKALPLYRSEGVAAELRKLPGRPSGSYSLSYRSGLQTNFGKAFLPVDAEVYLMDRSGRDSAGYFAPLEFGGPSE